MRIASRFYNRILLLSTIFYFLGIEMLWIIIEWQDFASHYAFYGERTYLQDFVDYRFNYFTQHWRAELLTFGYKIISFFLIVYVGGQVIADYRESVVKPMDGFLEGKDASSAAFIHEY